MSEDGAKRDVPASAMQQSQSAIPSFVLEYAPLLWLSEFERYMPSDIASQVLHTMPRVNHVPVANTPSPLTLDNLDQLNALGGKDVSLASRKGIAAYPEWYNGVAPDDNRKTNKIISSAIVTVDKANGILDAFYFYFHAFNEGNIVEGWEFGSHVGDWEHNMIRFQNGVPQAVYFSQHANSQTFTYSAVEKNGVRPVGYIAKGSHALYATDGTHDHAIPGLDLPSSSVEHHCDRGKLWDPTLSAYSYRYDRQSQMFFPYGTNFPVNWLYFLGRWGEDAWPDYSPAQVRRFGQRRYTGGPTGPIDKRLDRENMSGVEGDDWIWPCPTFPLMLN